MSVVEVRCDRDTLPLSVARSRKRAALLFLAFVYQFPLPAFIQLLYLADKPCAHYCAVGNGNCDSLDFAFGIFKDIQIHPLPVREFPNFKSFTDTILSDIQSLKTSINIVGTLYRFFPMAQDIVVEFDASAVRSLHGKPLFKAFFCL